MWKKAKRILSCILALVLLLSMANGQQVFVQADSEAVIKTQAEDKAGSKEASGNKEESSSSKTTEKKQETTTEKSTEKPAEKPTETTTESGKEDGKSDKPDKSDENNGKDSEDKDTKKEEEGTTENQDTKKEDKNNEEKSEDKAEETTDTAEETSIEEQENTAEEIGTTQEEATIDETEGQTESAMATTQTGTEVSGKEVEYIPKSQPAGVNIKAYAKDTVFPEGTVMKVKKLGEKELANAENALKGDKVQYDGCIGYDISFYNKDGKEIEPENGSVRVVMQMSDSIFPQEADTDTLTIQHLAEAKGGYDVEKVASVSSGSMRVGANKIKAEYTVKSFSDFVVTYSYVNTNNWKKEVKFYINKYSYIANSSSGGSSTMKENFTGAVGSATVTMPTNANSYNYTIEQASDGKSTAYIVIQGDKTGSAYNVDAIIRKLNTEGYDGFKISAVPSDASVLASIRTGNVDVQVNGKSIPSSQLTTDNFQVRWYVFKYNTTDQWHIDGILVPKSGRLQVTKTFSGLTKEEISQLKNKFAIDVRGETTYGENQYSLSLNKASVTNNEMTYTWTVDVYNTTYTVKEQEMDLDNWTRETKYCVNPDSSVTNGRVTDGTYDDDNGFSIKCVTKATDTEESTNQSVSLINDYTRKTVPLKLKKTITVDGTKTEDLDLSNLTFEIKDSQNQVVKTISFRDFTKKSTGVYEYSNEKDKFLKAGETYTITEMNTDLDGYKFNNSQAEYSKEITVGATDTEEEISFTNSYKQPTLTVKKLVAGNMPEKDKEFHFSMQFIKNNRKWTKELKQTGDKTLASQKEKYNFTLKDGESIQLKVPYGYTYELTEETAEGYKTYIGGGNVTKENYKNLQESTDKKSTGTFGGNDTSVTFVNEKNIVPPTGVNNTMTAWFLMTGATLILGAVFFLFEVRRKRLMA